MEHAQGIAQATRFSGLDGDEIMTKAEVAVVIATCAMNSELAELYGVTMEGDSKVVCYTGNGLKSKANAFFIAEAWNNYDRLTALNAELLAALITIAKKTDLDNPESHGSDDPGACLDYVHGIAKEAIQKAEGKP